MSENVGLSMNWLRQRILDFLFPPSVVKIVFDGGEPTFMPFKRYVGDAGWDIFCLERTVVPPLSFMDIPTGIRIDIPDGLWVRITGRSSTVRDLGLQVQEGIIDNGYTGPLFVGVWNLTNNPVTVDRGTRIAQIIFTRLQPVTWERGDLRAKDRGEKGFGSTNAS